MDGAVGLRSGWRTVAVIGSLVVVILTPALPVSAEQHGGSDAQREAVQIPILGCPLGAGCLEIWAPYERLAGQRHPWLRPVAQETPGFVYNVREMAANPARWRSAVYTSDAAVLWAASQALEPFFPTPLSYKDQRHLAHWVTFAFGFVTTDARIKTPADFAGRRVALGRRAQTTFAALPALSLKHAYDVDEDNTTMLFVGQNQALQAVLDGRAVAAPVLVYHDHHRQVVIPVGMFNELIASGRDFYYVSLDEEKVAAAHEELGLPVKAVRFKGTLPKSRDEVVWWGQSANLVAHKDFPDDLAYEFVRLLAEINTDVGRYVKIGELMTPDLIASPPALIPRHPGAARALRDLGLIE